MAEIRVPRVEQRETKIRNVPIAVTQEGFWCCPSPVVFQKTPLNKSKIPSSPPHNASLHKKQIQNPQNQLLLDDHKTTNDDSHVPNMSVSGDKTPNHKSESLPRKVSIEFGQIGTSDLKIVLLGKHGFTVNLHVHKQVVVGNSSFFAKKVDELESSVSFLVIDDCEDVEIYVETVGLMYCKDVKQRLIKQSVQRVLRVLKVAEEVGFSSCIGSCLDYLEAVPWVGEEEEGKVLSSVLRPKTEGVRVKPVLKRVSSNASKPPKDTLSHIVELVLKSNEERGRREMKSTVLKLLRENKSSLDYDNDNPSDICYETTYASIRACSDSLVSHFRQAKSMECKETIAKQIALDADNLVWLLEILSERQAADEFALMWASQQELADLHQRVPVMVRYHISCITARLFVGIGKGQLLPSRDTRQLLLQTWLEPLINDYSWLHHACRSFDRKVVEEGIGRTILTLPLEEQQSIMLSWLGKFLKSGDNCPNLQKAFEVWWRRTFIRPHAQPQAN